MCTQELDKLQKDDEIRVAAIRLLNPKKQSSFGRLSSTDINRILSGRPEVWSYLSGKIGMPECGFPHIPENLLYKTLSDDIHEPLCRTVYLPADMPEEAKKFFLLLATKYGLLHEVVDYIQEVEEGACIQHSDLCPCLALHVSCCPLRNSP